MTDQETIQAQSDTIVRLNSELKAERARSDRDLREMKYYRRRVRELENHFFENTTPATSKSIRDLMKQVHAMAVEKGFWEAPRNVGEMIALVHSELSEALEEHRNDRVPLYYEESSDSGMKPCGFAVELADALIRLLDIAAGLDLDLDSAIERKMAYNAGRAHKHGKAY